MPEHLKREIENLKKHVLSLGAVVEEQVRKSVEALLTCNASLAGEVLRTDAEIDRTEVEIEEECLKVLALHQPVASDLRYIVGILKINNDLERIGDLAVNIAERAQFLSTMEPEAIPFDLRNMAQKAQAMLKRCLDAMVNRDVALAHAVCAADDEVDAANRLAYSIFVEVVRQRPTRLKTLMHQFTAARQVERIADHATNIAEDVIYMVEGTIVRHRTDAFSPHFPESPSGKEA